MRAFQDDKMDHAVYLIKHSKTVNFGVIEFSKDNEYTTRWRDYYYQHGNIFGHIRCVKNYPSITTSQKNSNRNKSIDPEDDSGVIDID